MLIPLTETVRLEPSCIVLPYIKAVSKLLFSSSNSCCGLLSTPCMSLLVSIFNIFGDLLLFGLEISASNGFNAPNSEAFSDCIECSECGIVPLAIPASDSTPRPLAVSCL